jgi:TPR repeat protein
MNLKYISLFLLVFSVIIEAKDYIDNIEYAQTCNMGSKAYFDCSLKLCNKGNTAGCDYVGATYFFGEKPDYDKAIQYYDRRCQTNGAMSCVFVGMIYEDKKKDKNRALQYYKKACSIESSSCESYIKLNGGHH